MVAEIPTPLNVGIVARIHAQDVGMHLVSRLQIYTLYSGSGKISPAKMEEGQLLKQKTSITVNDPRE